MESDIPGENRSQAGLCSIDWIMTKTVREEKRGIQWTFAKKLEELDFADDIALLTQRRTDMQGNTDCFIFILAVSPRHACGKKGLIHIITEIP